MTRVMPMLALAAGLGAWAGLGGATSAQQAGPAPAAAASVNSKSAEVKAKPKPKPKAKPAAAKQPAGEVEAGDKTLDPEAALDQGAKALAAGKSQVAVGLAEQVLASVRKTPRTTARALALRGQARLRVGKPAEAMSDLDSAMWVKDGLGGTEREAATAARAEAYRQAGVSTPSAAPARVAEPAAPRGPATAALAAPAAPVPAFAPAEVKAAPAAPRERIRSPRPASASEPPTTTAEAPPSGGGVGAFFANLFGGASSVQKSDSGATRPDATGSIPAAKPSAVSASEPQRAPAQVGEAVVRPVITRREPIATAGVASAASAAVATAPPKAAVVRQVMPTGAFQVQLAAVRTRDAAAAMAEKVRGEHAAAVKGRVFEIDEPVFGNMGKFYRVRIGPFASATESLAICSTLRNNGLDCMVLGEQQ